MTTKEEIKKSKESALEFLNKHSKKFVIAMVILAGAALTASTALWYYRDELKPKVVESILNKKEPTKDEIEAGKINASTGGKVESVTSEQITISTVDGRIVSYKLNSNTVYTKGASQVTGSLNEINKGMNLSLGYNKDNNTAYNISY